ncbi:MAG: CinA family protein [Pseudomonadota bacterium]
MTAARLVQLGTRYGVTVATAESCTGGLVAGAITATPGSSAVFDRGFVTYSNAAKIDMLGVKTATLDEYGAVSEQIAAEMVSGALERSGADIAVSITGIAGPGGSEHKPEGRVCFGVATARQKALTETVEFGAIGRDNVRTASVDKAIELLIAAINACKSTVDG